MRSIIDSQVIQIDAVDAPLGLDVISLPDGTRNLVEYESDGTSQFGRQNSRPIKRFAKWFVVSQELYNDKAALDHALELETRQMLSSISSDYYTHVVNPIKLTVEDEPYQSHVTRPTRLGRLLERTRLLTERWETQHMYRYYFEVRVV